MNLVLREYGAGPEWPRGAGGRGSSLVVLAAAPPRAAGGEPGADLWDRPIVAADLLLDRDMIERAAREPGPPAPLLPPIPKVKAQELAEALRERGLTIEVHPADSWGRLVLQSPTDDSVLAEAREQALGFLLRGGLWEPERHRLDAVLREMVDNATLHGNRGRPDAAVRVDIIVSGPALRIAVSDQGEGFDPGGLAAALTPEPGAGRAPGLAEQRLRAGERGGLGLAMLRRWADRLWWADGGRRCLVEKRLPEDG